MSYSPYTPVSVSGYNQTEPPDDGTTGSDNQITWAGIKTNLTDPLNTAIAALDTNVTSAMTYRFMRAQSTQASNYSAVEADYGKVLSLSSNPVITLPDAGDVGEGWHITLVNVGSGSPYVDGNGSQTINGFNGFELSNTGDFVTLMSNGSNFVGQTYRSVGLPGKVHFYACSTSAPAGTLLCDGNTIGNADSGATYAHEKYRTLFNLLKGAGWGNVGTEAFDSDNTVALPDSVDNVPIGSGSTYTLGATGGAATKTLTQTEMPDYTLADTLSGDSHYHNSGSYAASSHDHSQDNDNNVSHHGDQGTNAAKGTGANSDSYNNQDINNSGSLDVSGSSSSAGVTISGGVTLNGSGSAFSLIQPYFAGIWCITY